MAEEERIPEEKKLSENHQNRNRDYEEADEIRIETYTKAYDIYKKTCIELLERSCVENSKLIIKAIEMATQKLLLSYDEADEIWSEDYKMAYQSWPQD